MRKGSGTYQVSVLGEHEIGLDVLDAQVDGQAVGLECVFRQVPARCSCVCVKDWCEKPGSLGLFLGTLRPSSLGSTSPEPASPLHTATPRPPFLPPVLTSTVGNHVRSLAGGQDKARGPGRGVGGGHGTGFSGLDASAPADGLLV